VRLARNLFVGVVGGFGCETIVLKAERLAE